MSMGISGEGHTMMQTHRGERGREENSKGKFEITKGIGPR